MKIRERLNSSFLKNAFFLFSGSLINALGGFVFWWLVNYFHDPAKVGYSSSIISITTWLGFFAILGLSETIHRYLLSSSDTSNLLNTSISLSLLLSVLLSLILTPILYVNLNYSSAGEFFYLLMLVFMLTVTNAILRLQSSIMVGHGSSKIEFLLISVVNVLKLSLVVAFFYASVSDVILPFILASFVSVIVGFILIKFKIGNIKLRFSIKIRELKPFREYTFQSFISRLFEDLPTAVLPYIILVLASADLSAFFFIPWTIASIYSNSTKRISTGFLVEGVKDSGGIKKTIKNASIVSIALSIIFILIIVFGGRFILSLYGSIYVTNSFDLLFVLSFSTIFLSIIRIYTDLLRLKQKLLFQTSVFGFIALGIIISTIIFVVKGLEIVNIGYSWLGINFVALVACLIHFFIFKQKSELLI